MTDRDALLAAIRENPDEDTPRLAFADWLDENGTEDGRTRAAFIRDQIALERLPDPAPDVATYLLRKELQTRSGVAEYTRGKAWLAELTSASQLLPRAFKFRRGFPDRVEAAADNLDDVGRVVEAAPIRELHLSGVEASHLGELLTRPWLAQVRQLWLSAGWHAPNWGPLADCPPLTNLESLRLSGGTITPGAATYLGHPPHLAGVRELTLSEVNAPAAGPHLIGEWFARLERLWMSNTGLLADGWEAIAATRALPNLKRLRLSSQRSSPIDAAAARAVTRSAFWPNLRELGIWSSDIPDEPLAELAKAPNPPALVHLELMSNRLTAVGVSALAASPLLRDVVRLRLDTNRIGADGLAALAGSPFAGNLGELLIDGNPFGPRGAEALARSKHLARLFALSVSSCEFGAAGFAHLAASPLLDQLVHLYVGDRSQEVKDLLHPRLGDRVTF